MGAESREVPDSGGRLTFYRPYLSDAAQLNNFLNAFLYLPIRLQGGQSATCCQSRLLLRRDLRARC
jgi:hypothetical protein